MKLNGWQRLWLIATALAGLWLLVLWPLRTVSDTGSANRYFAESLAADYRSGRCQAYIEKPLRDLSEPPYEGAGGTCWHLYTTRKVYEIDDVPFTRAKADRHETWQTVKALADVLLVGGLGFVCFSGGLYGLGLLVRWVRRGFAESSQGHTDGTR